LYAKNKAIAMNDDLRFSSAVLADLKKGEQKAEE
jgi:hypothetical protein